MLHNNALGVGMNMSSVKLPQVEINAGRRKPSDGTNGIGNISFINESSILKYLGISGTGNVKSSVNAVRRFNAIPLLAYWDIFKNYYANKQENMAYVIGGIQENEIISFEWNNGGTWVNALNTIGNNSRGYRINLKNPATISVGAIYFTDTAGNGHYASISNWTQSGSVCTFQLTGSVIGKTIKDVNYLGAFGNTNLKLVGFPLENIDNMREIILSAGKSQVTIDRFTPSPYNAALQWMSGSGDTWKSTASLSQSGLAVKTYQSDLYNNWLSKEWVDGVGGINEITAISTAMGSFSIDTLNLSNKVYNMLNRIAVSGGTYRDWLETVFTGGNYMERCETPIFEGGMSTEIVFQEVISNSASGEQPLGTLAGRGYDTGKQKGGHIKIKVTEPSFIMGIGSITPRIDYSQGNEFYNQFHTLDDIRKPQLDVIRYQDLMEKWMHADANNNAAVGKTIAWINYMTNVNKTYGNFAAGEVKDSCV